MSEAEQFVPEDGERVNVSEVPGALTRAPFIYADGATQVFTPDGRTTYTENGAQTSGEWGVDDDGQFWSFWPPSYRASYDLFWIADADADTSVGVRFVELRRGAISEGRYSLRINPARE